MSELTEMLTRAQRADGRRQALFNVLSALGRDAAQVLRRWSGRKDQGQRNHRENQPGDTSRHEHVEHVGDIEAKNVKSHVLQGLDVLQHREGEQEKEHRQGGQHGKGDIEAAMKLQPRAAMTAFREMLFVIPAHLRRYPGDVISPARQDGAYDVIITSGSSHSVSLVSKGDSSRLGRGCLDRGAEDWFCISMLRHIRVIHRPLKKQIRHKASQVI